MFRPKIQDTKILMIMAFIAILSVMWVSKSFEYIQSDDIVDKKDAVSIMSEYLKAIKKMPGNIISEDDLYKTGLIGVDSSLITTIFENNDKSFLKSKISCTHPNFAALIVHLFKEAELVSGDTVAVSMTGSLPGANLAFLAACDAMNIFPVILSSVGSSAWGANRENLTWLDMESILFNKGLINSRSVAASVGGRNDMGRLLSPAGREIIISNIENYNIPLIRKNRLAENIDERMKLFESFNKITNYSAMINVGGGVASLGTSFNSKLLPAGIVNRSDVVNISIRDGGIEGVLAKFAKKNVPVLHVLNIKSLTEKLGMPFAPIPIPEVGSGVLYAEEKYNILIATVCLFIVCGLVFGVGYQSKQKIKEHLIDHEPDSLL